LKKAPSYSEPASSHIFGPIAARTTRQSGREARIVASSSRIVVSGFFEKPAPTPIQSREGSSSRRSTSAAIWFGGVRSRAITPTPRSGRGAPLPKTSRVSRPLAPGWSFDHIES
jgi:hypothetical protein